MIVKKFDEFQSESPKCKVCGSRMYITDRGGFCVIYHCASDEARFWDFPRGSQDQHLSKKHWDESAEEVCKN
jgi:hypothetical protein